MAQGRAVSDDRVERILAGLRMGMTRRAAAAYGGIHHATLYRMMADSATLATDIERAEGEAEAAYTKLVADAAAVPRNWTAAAWWLERRKSADYARHDKVDVSIDLKGEVAKLAGELGLNESEVMAEAEAILGKTR